MGFFIIDDKWKARLEQMWAWQRNFSVTGNGVAFKNPPSGNPSLAIQSAPAGKGGQPLPPNIPRYCTLSSPVGSPGTPTTAPEITYTITYNGTTYPGSFPVKAGGRPFPKGVIITPATWGYMRFDEDGNPELLEAKEVWRVDPCIPPTP